MTHRYRQEQHPDGSWCVVSDAGSIVLGAESYQVAANVVHALNYPDDCPYDEAYDVAQAIAGHDQDAHPDPVY